MSHVVPRNCIFGWLSGWVVKSTLICVNAREYFSPFIRCEILMCKITRFDPMHVHLRKCNKVSQNVKF
jgi:hypothetical protein